MIISLDDIKGNSSILESSSNMITRGEIEENYFSSALNFVQSINEEIVNEKVNLYRAIAESNDEIVINESFQGFYEKVSAIIDKFIKFIKSLANKFIINLNKFISSDKYLKNHISDLTDFNSRNEFLIKGYDFNFSPDIPQTNVFATFNREFIGLDFEKLIKKDKKQQMEYLNSVKGALSSFDYDKLRGNIIKAKYSISESDFQKELFMVFRGGVSSKTAITVNTTYLNLVKRDYINYKDAVDSVERMKKEIEDDYKATKKLLKRIVNKSDDGDIRGLLFDPEEYYYTDYKDDDSSVSLSSLADKSKETLNLYVKSKIDQVTKISNIHSIAFGAKLQALKDKYKQDKYILYKALSKIQSNAYKSVKIKTESVDFNELESALFIEQQELDNIKLNRIVREAQLISEGKNTVENMSILNESLVDSAKNAILKVVKVIGTIWRKFVETINSLFNINKKNYLDKYRDIILKKELNPDNTYNMYDYPTALRSVLNNATVPQFNYESMKDHLNSDTDFVNQYFNNFAPDYNEQDDNHNNLRAELIKKFRGSDQEKELKASDIKMVDLYNYCYNYDNIIKNVQKDLDTVKAGAGAGLKLVDATVSANQSAASTNNSSNTNTNTPPVNGKEQTPVKPTSPTPTATPTGKVESTIYKPLDMRKKYYSSLYEDYLYEADNVINKNGGSNAGATKATFASQGSNINNTQAGTPTNNDNAIKNDVNNPDKQVEDIKNKINRYLKISSTFMNAKKDVFVEIYKIYMIIIKNHIRENLKNAGKNDNTGNTEPGASTQYQKGDNNAMVDAALNGKNESAIEKGVLYH